MQDETAALAGFPDEAQVQDGSRAEALAGFPGEAAVWAPAETAVLAGFPDEPAVSVQDEPQDEPAAWALSVSQGEPAVSALLPDEPVASAGFPGALPARWADSVASRSDALLGSFWPCCSPVPYAEEPSSAWLQRLLPDDHDSLQNAAADPLLPTECAAAVLRSVQYAARC